MWSLQHYTQGNFSSRGDDEIPRIFWLIKFSVTFGNKDYHCTFIDESVEPQGSVCGKKECFRGFPIINRAYARSKKQI